MDPMAVWTDSLNKKILFDPISIFNLAKGILRKHTRSSDAYEDASNDMLQCLQSVHKQFQIWPPDCVPDSANSRASLETALGADSYHDKIRNA